MNRNQHIPLTSPIGIYEATAGERMDSRTLSLLFLTLSHVGKSVFNFYVIVHS